MPQPRKDKSLSIRFTPEERAMLERLAAGTSLAQYIRERVLDEQISPRRKRHKFPVKDHEALSQVIGELGRTHIANNLNQIARAVNSGLLIMPSRETELVLLAACGEIHQIRNLIFKALGMKET